MASSATALNHCPTTGKVSFDSRVAAEEYARENNWQGQRPYLCDECSTFHLTKASEMPTNGQQLAEAVPPARRENGTYSRKDVELVVELRKAGKTYNQISAETGIRLGTVHMWFSKISRTGEIKLMNGEVYRSTEAIVNRPIEVAHIDDEIEILKARLAKVEARKQEVLDFNRLKIEQVSTGYKLVKAGKEMAVDHNDAVELLGVLSAATEPLGD